MESSKKPQDPKEHYRMAWTAYVRPVITFAVLIGVGYALAYYGYSIAGIVLLVAALLLITYHILSIRSVRLYTNDDGVWVYSGVFPWSKGSNGVKWRDLEDAVYYTGFWSWLLKSYSIRVGHRFTKSSEIILPHIARGNMAVEHINQFHSQVLASEAPIK